MNAEEIFHDALARPPAERPAFLAAACNGDERLNRQVAALLHAYENPGSFLDGRPPFPAVTIDMPASERPGLIIGRYKLIEQIGEGGMGTVWMAQQTEPVRRIVALKLIKPGMDSKQVLARFEAERQALALMDHPHIARVLDAGATESGRPYFVMELVKGIPITKYCDESRLTPKERLELFMPVCHAIQHAHQKGIIHRDIKPSNILVAQYDGRPVPKVIDFGLAKAMGQQLTEQTLVTGFGSLVGTLEYMSPEQAEMNQLDVDTRSDIYSLGVVLYELLTGDTPLDRKRLRQAAYAEMLRIIREEEPPKPSARLSHSIDSLPSVSAQRQMEPAKLTKLVRGELDWIVMKALEKDRGRRYETANGLAMDVERYLHDEPVLACPPSAVYQLKKFARRNRGRLVAAAVLGAVLLAGVAAACGTIGWVTRDRAARQARLVAQAELILIDADCLQQDQKWTEAAAAAERADAVLASTAAGDAIRQRIGEVQRDREFVVELDRLRQNRAVDRDEKSASLVSPHNFAVARAVRQYAAAFRGYGLDVESLPVAETVARLQRKPALVPPVVAALDDWAQAGLLQDESDANWNVLVAVARGLDRDPLRDRLRASWGQPVTPKSREELRRLADSVDVSVQSPPTLVVLARSLNRAELADAALKTLRLSQDAHPADFWLNVELAGQLFAERNYAEERVYCSTAVALRPDSALARNNLGLVLSDLGKCDEAIACMRKAIALDPKSRTAYLNLGYVFLGQRKLEEAIAAFKQAIVLNLNDARAHNNLGLALRQQRKLDEAVACYRKAIELQPRLAVYYSNLGAALIDQKKLDEATACCRKALELNPRYAEAWGNLGNALHYQKKPDEAIACLRQAVKLNPKLALAYQNLGRVLSDQKKLDEAIACYHKAIELEPTLAQSYLSLGVALYRQKKPVEAVACFQKAITLEPKCAENHYSLGAALLAQKRFDEAVACCRKAVELDPEDAKAYTGLGDALRGQNRLDDAVTCYRKAVQLDPNHAIAYSKLGNALYLQKKPVEAVACYRKAIQLDPDLAEAHMFLGTALQESQKKFDDAIACYRKAIEIDPQCANAYLFLGTALQLGHNKLDEAIACYGKAIEYHTDIVQVHALLGAALQQQGKLDEAIVSFRKAAEADPKDARALSSLGAALALRSHGLALPNRARIDEAISFYRKSIELNPKNELSQFNLGVAYLDQRNLESAIPCFEKVIELNPKNAEAHNNLGWALLSQEKLDRAIPCLQKAIQLNPTYEDAHDNLGRAYFRQKKTDEAVACYRKAIELNPKRAYFHYNLGLALHAQAKLEEAIAENLEAFRLDPKSDRVREWLLDVLPPLGRLEEFRAAWERVLASKPPDHNAWFGYAELCLFLKNEDAYRRNRKELLERFGNTNDPATAERTARACLLLPATGDELRTAAALADRAVTLGKKSKDFSYYAVTKALAEYRLDHFQSAIDWGQKGGARVIWPTLLVLAMAHQRLGHTEQARQLFDEAIRTYDWKSVNKEWGGIIHSLRREAEALLKIRSQMKEPASEKIAK